MLCILISVIGLFKFYNTKPALIHGTISILGVGTICIFISDTYSFYGLTSLALITWWSKIQIIAQNHRKFFIFIILTGFLIGFSKLPLAITM